MQNYPLQVYCLKLFDEIAKFLSQEKKQCKIAVIKNDLNTVQIVNFEMACQRNSLPCVTFNKELQIITSNFKNADSASFDTFDVAVSLFNLHSIAKNEQIKFIQKMHELAPKALFLEFENPERNLAYLGYFSFIFSQYTVCLLEKLFANKKHSVHVFQEYLKNGAVEGILFELPQILPDNSIKMLERWHFGLGSIGMAYLEWK